MCSSPQSFPVGICTAHVQGQWVWSRNTGYQSILQSEHLLPKTLIKTIKLIPDEPSICFLTLSELSSCLDMDFSGLWNWTKKTNYQLDWLWINSPVMKEISKEVFVPFRYVRLLRGVFFFVVFLCTKSSDLHHWGKIFKEHMKIISMKAP